MARSPSPAYDRVVLISLDTLRSDCVAANPLKLWPRDHELSVELETPVLDHLVAEGTFFANCVSAAPYTSASHATLLTGRWPLRHGVFELFNRKLRSPTLFDHGKRGGYRTVLKSDFPLILGPHLGFTSGVDTYLVEDDDGFLEALRTPEPTLALAHFGGIHLPYGFHNLRFGGQAFVDKVAELEAELPAALRPVRAPSAGATETDLLLRYKRAVQHFYAEGDYDRIFSLYVEGVGHFLRTRFEPFFTRLLDALGGRSFLLVVFGDHGEEYGEDAYGHQSSLAEGVLRVPLLFYGADCRPAVHSDRVRTVDLTPTVLDFLGDATLGRRRLDGSSLRATVTDGEPYPLRPAFAQSYIAENGAYLAYMKRLLLSGRKTGSLDHVLYKECVYDGTAKLTRRFYDYVENESGWVLEPSPVDARLEELQPDATWAPSEDPLTARRLEELLDSYNRTRRGVAPAVEVPDDIREQLQSMGYAV
jgi:choline-sulfatase